MLTPQEMEDARLAAHRLMEMEEKRSIALNRIQAEGKWLPNRLNIKALIAVHVTNFFPENGIIKTTGKTPLKYGNKTIIQPRETIHFTLNGPVFN